MPVAKIALTHERERWVFEVGETARYTDRNGRQHVADFDVTGITFDDGGHPLISTTLRGSSRHGWHRTIFWAGEFDTEN